MIRNERAALLAALRLLLLLALSWAGWQWWRAQREPDFRVDLRLRLQPAASIPLQPNLRMGSEVRHAWRLRVQQPVRFPVTVPGERAVLRLAEGTLEGLPELAVRLVRENGERVEVSSFEATEDRWQLRRIPLPAEPGEVLDVELAVLDGRGRPGLGSVFVADLVLESAGRPVDETAVPIQTRTIVHDLIVDQGARRASAPATGLTARVGMAGPACVPLQRGLPWTAQVPAVPAGARLHAVLRTAPALPDVASAAGRVALRDGAGNLLASLELAARPAGNRSSLDRQLIVALVDHRGGTELVLEREGGENLFVGVRELFITAPLPVPRRPFRPGRSVNVLLVVVDELRPDRLGCFGHARGHTPTLDALAARGGRYGSVFAPSSWSLPSVATLCTGTAPSSHGLGLAPGRVLSERAVTLARSASWAGFTTAAFVSNPYSARAPGLARGYERFEGQGLPAAGQVERALDWLEEARQFEWFLTLHLADLADTHAPFPEDAVSVMAEPDPALVQRLRRTHAELGAAEALALRLGPGYDADLAGVDRALEMLLGWLRRRGLLQDTLVAVVGSTGTEFSEHGGMGVGRSLHEELLRVPLLIAGPGVLRTGEVPFAVERPLEMMDVTRLLGHLGQLIAGSALQGRLPEPYGPRLAESPVLRALLRPFPGVTGETLDACRQGERLLLLEPLGEVRRLYDLQADPGATLDLLAEQGSASARTDAEVLERVLVDWHRAGLQAATSHPVPVPGR